MSKKNSQSSGRLRLACGTEISLVSLNQSSTYGGMLEGHPNGDMNAGLIQRFVKRVEKQSGWKPYLITPTERPVSHDLKVVKRPWVELPGIACEAYFFSRSFGEFGSSINVCWYQDDFAFPIDAHVLEALQNIAWTEHARPHDDF
ncbi:MAG: hypothetical protein IT422_21825 [Pirellulaceae bacterium]|jgi:hypothetical protein|nr:hypothetical protein [Pirellulaceae bacterium]